MELFSFNGSLTTGERDVSFGIWKNCWFDDVGDFCWCCFCCCWVFNLKDDDDEDDDEPLEDEPLDVENDDATILFW